jgi:hypothetical protein
MGRVTTSFKLFEIFQMLGKNLHIWYPVPQQILHHKRDVVVNLFFIIF